MMNLPCPACGSENVTVTKEKLVFKCLTCKEIFKDASDQADQKGEGER